MATIHAVGVKSDHDTLVYSKRVDGAWTTPEELSYSTSNLYAPSVVALSNGDVHILVTNAADELIEFVKSGGSWDSGTVIATGIWRCAAVCDSSDTIHLLAEPQSGTPNYRRKLSGGSWGASDDIGVSGYECCIGVRASDDTVWISYLDFDDPDNVTGQTVCLVQAVGGTLQTRINLQENSNYTSDFTSIGFDSTGAIYVAYWHSPASTYIKVIKVVSGVIDSTTTIYTATAPGELGDPQLNTGDQMNGIMVAYPNYSQECYTSFSASGASWTQNNALAIGEYSYDSTKPSIQRRLLNDGTDWLFAFVENPVSTDRTQMLVSDDDGATWADDATWTTQMGDDFFEYPSLFLEPGEGIPTETITVSESVAFGTVNRILPISDRLRHVWVSAVGKGICRNRR